LDWVNLLVASSNYRLAGDGVLPIPDSSILESQTTANLWSVIVLGFSVTQILNAQGGFIIKPYLSALFLAQKA
jgi:hypothetical protein